MSPLPESEQEILLELKAIREDLAGGYGKPGLGERVRKIREALSGDDGKGGLVERVDKIAERVSIIEMAGAARLADKSGPASREKFVRVPVFGPMDAVTFRLFLVVVALFLVVAGRSAIDLAALNAWHNITDPKAPSGAEKEK